MAPWPEPETEPKAPDKTGSTAEKPCEAATATMRTEKDAAEVGGACRPAEDKKDSGVSSLDDQGLQALLDEAIAYKNPKDREQKSALFKELLAKAEEDEREHSGGQRGISGIGGSSGRYRRGLSCKGDERNSRGGSLQNLAQNSDRRGGRRNPQPQVSVSARQREGGSLPCNVNNAGFYGAAALHRSHDDVGTSTSVKKREHTTPIDDVVTGNSYCYKLPSASSARTADDLSGYRPCHWGKKGTDPSDDIKTAAPRGSGSKRREFKKLGHSSDAIFPESTSDICSMEDLSKDTENNRVADIRNDCENVYAEFAPYMSYRNHQNHVDRSSSDHSIIGGDHLPQINGPSMLGAGMNGSLRSGSDHKGLKSDSRKDDDIDGTEMTSFEQSCDNAKYRPNDHEVDQPISSDLLSKFTRSNGEAMVPSTFNIVHSADISGGDSMRTLMSEAGDKSNPRARSMYQIPPWDSKMQLYRVDRHPQFSAKEPEKRSFDENGNALHQGTGTERKFKPRKNKTDNNNYVLSEKIPGHRGGTQDINELLNFIETPSNCQDVKSSISGKNNRNTNGPATLKESKQRNNSSSGKRNEAAGPKVKAEKRKSNEKQKLKKSNSLEEISCTKLSDLTSSDNTAGKEMPSTQDDETCGRESRQKNSRSSGNSSSGSERGSGSSSSSRKQRESSSSHQTTPPSGPVDSQISTFVQGGDLLFGDPAEFHVVTKKQRKKKSGRSSSIGRNERNQHSAQSNNYHREAHSRRSAAVDDNEGNILYQYRSAPYRSESPDHNQHHRRKSTSSMPPSDKSDTSDLDSVHSLPISSTTPKPVLDKTSTSSGSTPQASYADIARMASAMSPPQGSVCPLVPPALTQTEVSSSGLPGNKWPSVGQARPPPSSAPLWTANVTLHTATPLPASHEEGDQCLSAPVPAVSSSSLSSSTKRDAMTNTSSLAESESTDCSSVGNLLSDDSYPPLCESGKSQTVLPHTVTQCVQTFISQASRTSPAISPGVTMANCVDVEDSAKRAASPAAFDSARDNSRTSTLDRPAVIILDEAETETPLNGDPELTFGFEINEMLLSGSCVISSDEEMDVKSEQSASLKTQPSMNSLANINLDKIVAFVGRAWEDVIKELPQEAGVRGRVQFYNGQ